MDRLVARLSRSTTSGKVIAEVDGLRFLSIACVILYHAAYYTWPAAPRVYAAFGSHGNFGVQMFFVISGFILGLPFAETHLFGTRQVSLRRYFVRRLTRLEPPYIINLLLWFAIKVVFLGRTFGALLPNLLASMTYTHNLVYGRPSDVNFYAWSLEVEVQFYILAPLLAQVFRLPRGVRLGLLATAIAAASFVPSGLSLATQSQWFLVGFVLADVYLVSWDRRPTTSFAWDAVALVAWPLLFVFVNLMTQPGPYTAAFAFASACTLLVAYMTAFRGTLTRSFLRWPPVYVVGGMCYSIYLYHGYVLEGVMALQKRYLLTGVYALDTLLGLAAIAVAVTTSCAVVFVVFEKPFMDPGWHLALWARIAGRASEPAKAGGETTAAP